MIGIDMELPKNAETCRFRHSIYDWCVIDKKPLKRNKSDKCLVCPLVDLGKEDMSWEELKEKCKTFIVKIDKTTERRNIEYFEIEPCGLSFWEDGTVLDEHNDIILTNQSNFKMYQIIKSLVGDER